jgi:hypothetical protein
VQFRVHFSGGTQCNAKLAINQSHLFSRQNSETGSLLVEGQLFLEDVDLGGHLRGLEVCVLQALNSAVNGSMSQDELFFGTIKNLYFMYASAPLLLRSENA